MTPLASTPDPAESGRNTINLLFTALRGLGVVMLALMAVSIAYAIWIAMLNWGHIQV